MLRPVLLLVALGLALAQSAGAATRLGLHVTDQELAMWRARMTDNVTTMNGFTFQAIYNTRILAEANIVKGQTMPNVDGHWTGWTGSGCAPNTNTTAPNPGGAGSPYGRGSGARLARSAFVFLLTGDETYATPVKNVLLSQINQAGTNWANTAKWCTTGTGRIESQNSIETIPWLYRLLLAYDYLNAGNYGGFTPTDKANIVTWFRNAANLFDTRHREGANAGAYKGIYSTPQSFACTGSPCTASGPQLYYQGPFIVQATNPWNNVGGLVPMYTMAFGLMTNDGFFIDNSKRWVQGFLRAGVFDNGASQDFTRWGSFWAHIGGVWGTVGNAIDLLARTGDTYLYTYGGPTLVPNGSGGNVTWKTVVDIAARMIRRIAPLYYETNVAAEAVPGGTKVMTWDNGTPDKGQYYDFALLANNLFYKDASLTIAMQRNLLAGNHPSTGCYDDNFGGCFSGVWGFWPDLPFMYGKPPADLNPYQFTAPEPDWTTALRLHLKFDEGSGTTAQDATVNNHDGTLGTGASWGAAKLGTSAVALDGTVNGKVTVTGGLTDPTNATLAAWVYPTAWPTTNNDVINLRNAMILRLLNSGSVRGSFNSGAGYVGVTVTPAAPLALNTWHHVAYTLTPNAQVVYVNGVELGRTSSASAATYTGMPADTLLGAHPTTTTDFRFQGRIDDVRVYTRALSAQDIAGLAAVADPSPLSIQITAPVNADAYSTDATPLANLGGTASDNTGVTGVTWSCPTCTPTSGTATCTPACGAATSTTNWVVASIGLGVGSNPITVTASEAGGTQTDTLTVTYTPPPLVGPCSYYASQAGGGNGLAQGSPFRVSQFLALPPTPGMTLCLLAGTYTGAGSMMTPAAGLAGTSAFPITMQALTDGTVLLDGEHARNPVVLGVTNEWFVIQGLNAQNGLTAVYEFLGPNNLGKRLLGWNGTVGQPNATIFTVQGQNTWVEDCGGWGRNARTILQGSSTTASTGGYRRCWEEWNAHPGGTASPGRGMVPGEGQRFENVIGTWNAQ